MPSTPSFIAIGHLTFDVNIVDSGTPTSHIPGGAAAYAALTSHKHDISTGVISSVGEDYPVDLILKGIDVQVVESEHTATFANYYDSGDRTQVLMASGNLSCLLPSGWLRRWGPDGAISHADTLPPFRGKKWDIIVVSESEIETLPEQQLFDISDIVCVTRGDKGSRIWHEGSWIEVPVVYSNPVDFTGAGDIWAAAFAIAISEGQPIAQAGLYAAIASAIAIESTGLSGCPSRDQIQARLG
jgi:sugar/nucleoside kinase (ribokinase family)